MPKPFLLVRSAIYLGTVARLASLAHIYPGTIGKNFNVFLGCPHKKSDPRWLESRFLFTLNILKRGMNSFGFSSSAI